jgi:hypothetical protein
LCKSIRANEDVRYSRFYWYGADTIVILTEAEATAFEPPPDPEAAKAAFALADLAKSTMNWRLSDPRTGEETYRKAGR